ncbi:MAG TPA: NADP-dependent oxidoreductase [Micromonosporaceae bacterium]
MSQRHRVLVTAATGGRTADHPREIPATMTAARIREYGDASVIQYEKIPVPAPRPGEVLIRVAATSFNPSETALRSGWLRAVLPVALPYTLGWDMSGTIVQVGEGVAGFSAGDRVIGRLDAGGAAAGYVTAPAHVLAKAPAATPLADAAAIPVAGLAAWQALFEYARITAGQRILLNGAGGGVGVFAVQLARHAGAIVIATASGRSAAAVRRYGADQVVDYTSTPLVEALDGPVDAVVNLAAVTSDAAADLVPLVRPGGVIVSIATPVEPPTGAAVTTTHLVARSDAGQLADLVALVDAGELVVDIAESHPLRDLASVHRRSEAGETRGKIIILP